MITHVLHDGDPRIILTVEVAQVNVSAFFGGNYQTTKLSGATAMSRPQLVRVVEGIEMAAGVDHAKTPRRVSFDAIYRSVESLCRRTS